MKDVKYRCPKCGGDDTTLLFISWVCNACNPALGISAVKPQDQNGPYYAWIVNRTKHVERYDWFLAHSKEDATLISSTLGHHMFKVQAKECIIVNDENYVCVVDDLDCKVPGAIPVVLVKD